MSERRPAGRPEQGWRRFTAWLTNRSVTSVVALWSLAVAQPLLDLFGHSPEFFVANGLSRLEIIVVALAIVLVGPVVLIGLELAVRSVSPPAARVVHLGVVGLLSGLLALSIQRQLDVEDAVIVAAITLLAAVAGAYVEDTEPTAQKMLGYLALSPILFLAGFVAFSPVSDLLLHPGAEAVAPGSVESPAPVVFLSLDEFPLASLLRADGTINDERFPNIARLAEASTWYPQATSAASNTTFSVPATLTGRLPEADALPTARDHPRSLFTLLAGEYDEWVREQVTDVCPRSICPVDSRLLDLDTVWSAIADSAAVYSHLVTPPSFAEHLPVVDRSWGGFVTAESDSSSSGSQTAFVDLVEAAEDTEGQPVAASGPTGADPACPDAAFWCGPSRVSELIESVGSASGPGPHLWYVHATTPHIPWIYTPEGQQYLPRGLDALAVDGLGQDNAWSQDTSAVRQAFQRHLLQVGTVDRLVGQLIDEMEADGIWDDALVVLVADHGVAFSPGLPARAPTATTIAEIFNVPLFIKAPGQVVGRIHRGNALTIDVLPTIVDLLDIETPWTFDGESLLEDEHRVDKPVFVDGSPSAITSDFDDVLTVARRNRGYLPFGNDWVGVAAVGLYGDLVGRRIQDVDTDGAPDGSWQVDQAGTLADWDPGGGALAPILLSGTFTPATGSSPDEALVVLNGRVAGVALGFEDVGSGAMHFQALVAEEFLRSGANSIELLVPTDGGSRFQIVPHAG